MPSHPDSDTTFWSSLEKRVHAEWLAITFLTVLTTLLVGLYSEQTGIARLDDTFYDGVLRAWPNDPGDNDIVIIAIDDGSIDALGRWPWHRSVHAELLGRLSEARRVGFDIVFSEPNPDNPEGDHAFAQAVTQHGRVVLPTFIMHQPGAPQGLHMPLPVLANAAAGLGYINIYPDSDGTVRSLTLQRTLSDNRSVQHFVVAMHGQSEKSIRPDDSLRIPFRAPAGHFPFYSYASVLRGDVPSDHFRDRLVLVGAWSSGLGDTYPTPMTTDGQTMSGVEIMANGMLALKHDTWIRTLPAWASALLNALPVLLTCLAVRRFSPRHSFLATLSIISLWALLAVVLLISTHVWLPVTSGLIGIALAFPLWSWRSQEASLQHIDRELQHLRRAIPGNAGVIGDAMPITVDRSLPARVRLLHQAIARFRHAQQKREETLRFLSHDARAPQNAILALIEMQRREPESRDTQALLSRIEQRAADTLALMDGFVQLERAECLPLNKRLLDLGGLLQEACDAGWEVSRRRSISVMPNVPSEPAWVEGDHQLLGRALRNLLDNAVKYSPEHTTVHCRLARKGATWEIAIQDQGPGIPEHQLGRIFEPFARVTAEMPAETSGAGLGLAFVRITIERHGGTITASSIQGRGSTFTIALPAMEA